VKWLVILLVACSSTPRRDAPPAEPVLAQLPKPAAVNTEKFAGVIVCDRCHTAGATQMRDSKGRDISPVTEMRANMMMLSARDPYYLAALAREIAANPGAKPVIEATCNRCHAPR
jgi:cytochrome c5